MARVSIEQSRWFTLRRSGLVAGLESFGAVARRLCGVQAQVQTAAFYAVARRLASRPTRTDGERALLEARNIVRLTAQRGTVHVYPPEDVALVAAAVGGREVAGVRERTAAGITASARDSRSPRRDGAADLIALDATCEAALTLLSRRGRGPAPTLGKDEFEQHGWDPRLAYGVFACLTAGGGAVRVERGDNATPRIAALARWAPVAGAPPRSTDDAMVELGRRYFEAYGPATERDLRHWLGVKASDTKPVVATLLDRGDVATVSVDGAPHLLATDLVADLTTPAPRAADWPFALLYRFDPLMLAYHDKSRWLDDATDAKKVWHGTHVEPVIMVNGTIRGTWRYTKKSRSVSISLRPFRRKLSRAHASAARAEAVEVARFLGLELGPVEETMS